MEHGRRNSKVLLPSLPRPLGASYVSACPSGRTYLPSMMRKTLPRSQNPFGLGPRMRHGEDQYLTHWLKTSCFRWLTELSLATCRPWAGDKVYCWMLVRYLFWLFVMQQKQTNTSIQKKKKKKKYDLRLWKQLDRKNSKPSFLQEHHVWRTYPASKVNPTMNRAKLVRYVSLGCWK